MNIYEKLQEVRVSLQEMNLKKSGHNSYSNYDYFEMADFLPHINNLMKLVKMTSVVSFTSEMATLTLIDCEKPDSRIVFTSPMAKATLKAAHDIQNLGAVETYERRYLYMTAFEIVEADMLDHSKGAAEQTPSTEPQGIGFVVDTNVSPQKELERLWARVGWDAKALPDYIDQRSKQMNTAVNDTFYQTILREQVDYLRSQGMSIDYMNELSAQAPFE